MTVCSNCGAEVTRSRLIWDKDGKQREECPQCAPQNFEKFTVPSDKVPWMGWEAHPNEYEKKYDKDGVIYERKPEYRAEQEERLRQPTEEERLAQERALAKKRAERRTKPMDSVETAMALRKAEEVADWIKASTAEGRDVN
jgi:hypothetical protein